MRFFNNFYEKSIYLMLDGLKKNTRHIQKTDIYLSFSQKFKNKLSH